MSLKYRKAAAKIRREMREAVSSDIKHINAVLGQDAAWKHGRKWPRKKK